MDRKNCSQEDRASKLIDSLELITARMLEVTTLNSQIATSQTPEMQRLFNKWIDCISSEILRSIIDGKNIDIDKVANSVGVSRTSALSLLLALERRGDIFITGISVQRGNGKNSDICDCLLS